MIIILLFLDSIHTASHYLSANVAFATLCCLIAFLAIYNFVTIRTALGLLKLYLYTDANIYRLTVAIR